MGGGFHSKRWIPPILTRYCLRMGTVNGDGRGGLLVEVDVHVEEVGGPIGEINRREWVSPQIADIARTRSILPVNRNG